MLKLKLQYFGHLMLNAKSLKKTLILVRFGGRRMMVGWHQLLNGHEFKQTSGVDGQGRPVAAVHVVTKSWT